MRQVKIPHLYKRNSMFYFRYRLSKYTQQLLKRWELCHSLGTTDFDKAALICIRLRPHAQELDKVVGELAMKKLTEQKAEELVQWYFQDRYEESEVLLGMDMSMPNIDLSHELTDVTSNKLKMTKEILSKQFSFVTVHDAKELLEKNGLELPEKGLARLQLLEGIAKARYEIYRIYIETIKGNYHERAIKDPLFANLHSTQPAKLSTPTNYVSEVNAHSVKNLIEKYVAKKSAKGWTKKTIEENTRCLNWLKEMLGHKLIKLVTKKEMRDFRDMIELIPKNYTKNKKLKELTIQEAVEVNKGKDVISPATAKKYWGVVTGFMNWLVPEDYLDKSPAKGLEVEVQNNALDAKDPFSHEQLKAWFNSPIYLGCYSKGRRLVPGDLIILDAIYWVPLIGLFTGMRLGEIMQMSTDDLCLVGDVWVFDVKPDPDDTKKSVKTKSAIRKIPLHRSLLEFGFIQFCEKQKMLNKKRIFEEIKPSSKGYYSDLFSKKFGYQMKKLGIKTDKTSFHSFRHNMKNELKDNDTLDTHQNAILGHAQSGMNAVYGSNKTKKLKDCIDKVEYDVDLSHLIPSSSK